MFRLVKTGANSEMFDRPTALSQIALLPHRMKDTSRCATHALRALGSLKHPSAFYCLTIVCANRKSIRRGY